MSKPNKQGVDRKVRAKVLGRRWEATIILTEADIDEQANKPLTKRQKDQIAEEFFRQHDALMGDQGADLLREAIESILVVDAALEQAHIDGPM